MVKNARLFSGTHIVSSTHRIIARYVPTYIQVLATYAPHIMYDTSRLQHAQHEKKPGTPGTGNASHMYDTSIHTQHEKKPDTGYAPHMYDNSLLRSMLCVAFCP